MSDPTWPVEPRCPNHPRHGTNHDYWRGCPHCHPVVVLEDLRDRLMSDVIDPKTAIYELLCMKLDEMGVEYEPLRLVTYNGLGTLTRHNVGAINGLKLPEPKSLW